jgi:predicted metal-dependent peptidase
MRHGTPTSLRIQKARTALLLDHPFFGSLLFRLKGRESRSIATMATDGVSLYYNPEFVDTLNSATLSGVLAHEVLHPGLHHHARRNGRDPRRWNEACDYAINPLLLDAGLSLPDGVLVDSRFREMSAEQIYNLLEAEAEQQSGNREGKNETSGDGTADAPSMHNDSEEPSAPLPKAGSARFLMPLRAMRRLQASKSRPGNGVLRSARR